MINKTSGQHSEQPKALVPPSALLTILTMFPFSSIENAQRKYVDLIWEAATKWPNWDPPRSIRVSIAVNS